MKNVAPTLSAKSYLPLKPAFLLSTFYMLLVLACVSSVATPVPTLLPTLTSFPDPIIFTIGSCDELAPGAQIPLAVTGVPGSGIVYTWSASAGVFSPPVGMNVLYTAPSAGGDVIITVVAEKGGQTSDAMITCTVIAPAPLPTDTPPPATLAPTLPAIPTATKWTCTSYRPQKPIEKGNIPGEVKIDKPAQGAMDIPARASVQAAGTSTGIPEGKYLWLFVYSQKADRYYPQTMDALTGWQPDPTTGQDGGWLINISFGAPQECFEVIVMVAELSASQSIADQLEAWAAVNTYSGYKLNGPSSANPPESPGFPDGIVEKASVEVWAK